MFFFFFFLSRIEEEENQNYETPPPSREEKEKNIFLGEGSYRHWFSYSATEEEKKIFSSTSDCE